MMRYLVKALCGTALATAMIPTAVSAQDSGAAESSAPDEIIVTAQKRASTVQDVPAAISAIGGEDLARSDISNVQSLANHIPNLTFGTITGATQIAIRGVGTSVETGLAEPSVALYVDGIYLPRSTMGAIGLKDLDRVEVLRGPQGTLYGRNATGGAINFISNKPTADLQAGIDLKYGNYDRKALDAFVSGPLSDKVLARVSGGFERRDGYVRNLFNGQGLANANEWHGRAQLRFIPTEDFTLDLAAQYMDDRGTNSYQELLPPILPGAVVGTDFSIVPRTVTSDYVTKMYLKTLLLSANAEWEVSDAVSIRSITGYVRHRTFGGYDGDSTPLDFVSVTGFRRPSRSISQEINLYGETGRLQWLLGGYYFNENFSSSLPVNILGGASNGGLTILIASSERTRSYAAFGELTYALTDKLSVTGGLRYNSEKKRGDQGGFPAATDDSRLLPKIALRYNFSDRVFGYAQFQRGLKSGGFNSDLARTNYRPEILDAYEIGLKSELLDRRVTLNLAAFEYHYNGYQNTRLDPPVDVKIENADAKIRGLEGELVVRPNQNWRFNLSANYLDAKYTSFLSLDPYDPGLGLQDLSGNRLSRAPKFTFAAGLEHVIPFDGGLADSLTLRGDVYHSSAVYFRPFNLEPDTQRGFTFLNASSELAFADGKYFVRFFANNISNKRVKTAVIYSASQLQFVGLYNNPRTYGIELSARF